MTWPNQARSSRALATGHSGAGPSAGASLAARRSDHFERATNADSATQGAAQNAAQQVSERDCTERKAPAADVQNQAAFPADSTKCGSLQDLEIAATGLEPVTRGL